MIAVTLPPLTDLNLDCDGQAFTVQGHRELGSISKRSGILGKTVTMTLGGRELDRVEKDGHSIKMIVDDNNNFIMVSITKMKENGFSDHLNKAKYIKLEDSRSFYSWSLPELDDIGAILYQSIEGR